MKLNGTLIRSRRHPLGLTGRELARCAHVTIALITRLEQTGDISCVRVETVVAILSALGLDLPEALDQQTEIDNYDNTTVAAIGSLLQHSKKGVPPDEIATAFCLTLDQVEQGLQRLAHVLRPAGLRLVRRNNGHAIVPSIQATSTAGPKRTRRHYLANLNQGDMSLLYGAMTTTVLLRTVANTTYGNVTLQRLTAAGLIIIDDGRLRIDDAALASLMS
jgi:transcriptional regulator with XRE-family HTH domain